MANYMGQIAVAAGRAREIETELSNPDVAKEPGRYQKLAKELGGLQPLVRAGERYRQLASELEETRAMTADSDPDMAELARGELEGLEAEKGTLEAEIQLLLVPKDPNDEKNAIFEIRAGAGGDEAALFSGDLFRMYGRYAEQRGWKLELLSSSASASGGFKEVIAMVSGGGVFSRLKFERGVHRVQRVPATESQGRIHTSTVTVAVMPEAEEVDIEIDPQDLRVDVMRAGGPGGQSVNTTDSAVRMTHIPTGLVVQCQDEKSQHKNKAKALKVLRSRLLELEQQRADDERANARRAQIGSGDRSEKIRTYNFPQGRVTDHRAGVTLHQLASVLDGDMDELLDAVAGQMAAKLDAESQ